MNLIKEFIGAVLTFIVVTFSSLLIVKSLIITIELFNSIFITIIALVILVIVLVPLILFLLDIIVNKFN